LKEIYNINLPTALYSEISTKFTPDDLNYTLNQNFVVQNRRMKAIFQLGRTKNLFAYEFDLLVASDDLLVWVRLLQGSWVILGNVELEAVPISLGAMAKSHQCILLDITGKWYKVKAKTSFSKEILYNDTFVDARTYSLEMKMKGRN